MLAKGAFEISSLTCPDIYRGLLTVDLETERLDDRLADAVVHGAHVGAHVGALRLGDGHLGALHLLVAVRQQTPLPSGSRRRGTRK